MRESRTLRERLSPGASSVRFEPNLSDDAFYQVVRPAIAALPESGPKRQRVLYQGDNWIVAAKRQLIESLAAGAPNDAVLRVAACFGRAVRELLHQRRPMRTPADVVGAILRETATNGFENLAAIDVLSMESIGTIEAHWQSARAQRDASQALMEALEHRAFELARDSAA